MDKCFREVCVCDFLCDLSKKKLLWFKGVDENNLLNVFCLVFVEDDNLMLLEDVVVWFCEMEKEFDCFVVEEDKGVKLFVMKKRWIDKFVVFGRKCVGKEFLRK